MLLDMKQESQHYHMLCNLKNEYQLNGDIELKASSQQIYNKFSYKQQEGQIFGEVEFFSGLVREHVARTLNVTNLAYVEYEDFIETVKFFPEDYEQVLQTKDNINLYNKSKGLDHKCFSCFSFEHRLKQCPLVNYIPNRVKIMHNFNRYQDQQRSDETARKDFRNGKSLKQIKYLKQSAMRLHFHLYNEQLLNEDELSQFDFDVDSDDNTNNQSNSIVYQQSPQQMMEKSQQAGIDIPRGFMLNNSFIAAETPKHQQKINKINTMLMKSSSKGYSRSNTNKLINGLPLSEPNSNGTNGSIKQDAKSKFYRQTQHISQIPSAKENSFQSNHHNQEQSDDKDIEFSDHNIQKSISQAPFIFSPHISHIPDKSMKEESNHDDFNNIQQENEDEQNEELDQNDFKQIIERKQTKEMSLILRQQKMDLRIETPRRKHDVFPIDNLESAKNQNQSKSDNAKESISSIHQSLSQQRVTEIWNQLETNNDLLKSSYNQINSDNNGWRNTKNVNFEKIKPNVLTFQKLQSNEAQQEKNGIMESPDQYQQAYFKEMIQNNNLLFNKKNNLSKSDKNFKKALQSQIDQENGQINSFEEILSIVNSPQKQNTDDQLNLGQLRIDQLKGMSEKQLEQNSIDNYQKNSIQVNHQQQYSQKKYPISFSPGNMNDQGKEYAKPPLEFMTQQQVNEGAILQVDYNDKNFQPSQPQSQDKFYVNNFKVEVISPASPPPAQEKIKKKRKGSKRLSENLNLPSSSRSLKLLKVPMDQHNNSEITNFGENQTTQRTIDNRKIVFDGVSQSSQNGLINNMIESNYNSEQNNGRLLKPSIFQNSSLISEVDKINKDDIKNNQDIQFCNIDLSGQLSSEQESGNESSSHNESIGNNSDDEKKEDNRVLMGNDISQINSFYADKPQINIIRDSEEVIIQGYKHFKKNISSSNKLNIGAYSKNLGVNSKNLGFQDSLKRCEIDTKKAKNSINPFYYHQEHETPSFQNQKNQFQKNLTIQSSQRLSTLHSPVEVKKINNSFQHESTYKTGSLPSKIKNNQNSSKLKKSPQTSLKEGTAKSTSHNNLKEQMTPSEFNILQQQAKLIQQVQKQNNHFQKAFSNLNTPTDLIRQGSKLIDFIQSRNQAAFNKMQTLKRTETITTNNSPIVTPMLMYDNKKRSSEMLVQGGPSSLNQLRMINQYDCSPVPLESEELNLRVIRDSVENFDKFRICKKYFVYNNLDIVINQINKKRKNKAIVQKIRQFNIRKKKTLIAVNKLNIKRSGAITENNNISNSNYRKSHSRGPQRNSTFQIVNQSEVDNNQQFDSKTVIHNTQNNKFNNNNINYDNQLQTEQMQPILIFNSDQNLIQNKNSNFLNPNNGRRKSIFFVNKEEKLTEDNQNDDQTNLIAPTIKLSSNFLSPRVNQDQLKNFISKSAEKQTQNNKSTKKSKDCDILNA